jgi:hypothetical protein
MRVFCRAAHGVEGRHVTPERVLRASGGFARANLLKREQLKKKSRHRVAVQQPQVSAGELVDSEARLLVSAANPFKEAKSW